MIIQLIDYIHTDKYIYIYTYTCHITKKKHVYTDHSEP